MSRSVNEVILVGRVGNDPEIRSTTGGGRIAKLSLATDWKYRDKERTDWHRLVVFGRTVDVVEEFVRRGDRLYVRGRIEYSSTEKDGQTRFWTDIVVNDLVMLSDTRPKVEQAGSSLPDLDF